MEVSSAVTQTPPIPLAEDSLEAIPIIKAVVDYLVVLTTKIPVVACLAAILTPTQVSIHLEEIQEVVASLVIIIFKKVSIHTVMVIKVKVDYLETIIITKAVVSLEIITITTLAVVCSVIILIPIRAVASMVATQTITKIQAVDYLATPITTKTPVACLAAIPTPTPLETQEVEDYSAITTTTKTQVPACLAA